MGNSEKGGSTHLTVGILLVVGCDVPSVRLIWGVLVHGVVGILGANDVYVATVVSAAPVNELGGRGGRMMKAQGRSTKEGRGPQISNISRIGARGRASSLSVSSNLWNSLPQDMIIGHKVVIGHDVNYRP